MGVEILGVEAGISPPDSDGDCRLRVRATYEPTGDEGVDWVQLRYVVRDGEGLPIVAGSSEEDEDLSPGETGQLQESTYLKFALDDDATVSGSLRVCRVDRVVLGQIPLPQAGAVGGAATPVEAAGITVDGWSVVVGKPDSDGDVRVNAVGLLRNDGGATLPRVVFQVRFIKRKGDEESSDDVDVWGLAPGESRAVDAYTFLKERWLSKGMTAEVSVRVFADLGTATFEAQGLELRAR